MERDHYGYVEFVEMQNVPVLFNEKPSFNELVARAREELHSMEMMMMMVASQLRVYFT